MNYRWVVAGTITACVIAGTGASVAAAGTAGTAGTRGTGGTGAAAGSAGQDKAPGTTTKAVPPGAKPSSDIADIASELGVTEQQLLDALPAVKQAAVADADPATPGRVEPDSDAAAARLASSLHVSRAAAERAFAELMRLSPKVVGKPRELPDAETMAALASYLHVSTDQAQRVWDELSPGDGMIPTSPEFAAVASSIGKTPAQLQESLRAFKTRLVENTSSSAKLRH